MSVAEIVVPTTPGTLSVAVASPGFPHALAGVLWRYKPDRSPDGKAGTFTPQFSSVAIGSLASCAGRFFMIEGAVLEQDDDPPTPYQVVVSISLGDRVIHQEVPGDGGTGSVGNADVPWVYRFHITSAP